MALEESDIHDAWQSHDTQERIRSSKVGCCLALVLLPAGTTLDLFYYPNHFVDFAAIRLLADFCITLVLLLHYTRFCWTMVGVLISAWILVAQAAICLMIYSANGFDSTYYAGLNLAILALGILLPVTMRELVVLSTLTLILYTVAGFAHGPSDISFAVVYNNFYFLIITAFISATAVYFNRRRRFREFSLNFELNVQNRKLSELDRIKSEFFANISHEFRTPLTLILAPLDRVLQEAGGLPAKTVQRLELIQQNSLRLLRLVNDLLDVIRLEDGNARLERHKLRFDKILTDVVDSMTPLAEARGLTLSRKLSDRPIVVSGDRSALEKVFFNLLSNAIKFTERDGRITIRSRLEGESVRITVEDTGIGMSRTSLPHVFDRFRQADSSSTRRYGGTGLGLALVKEITEEHGGQVTIDSEQGVGTCVDVCLPVYFSINEDLTDASTDQPADDQALAPQRELDMAAQLAAISVPVRAIAHAKDGYQLSSSKPTVLIVDDEPDMREYLADLLGEEYSIQFASNGEDALVAAQRYRPELVILDLMLPEIDGLEVCRRIKQSRELGVARIVLLTARAREPSKLAALENGADDFLTKPFSSIEVQTRLRNLLRNSRLEQSLNRQNRELADTLARLSEAKDQLINSEKLNALGRLSAGLLHEINNPLNYTLAALDFAKNGPLVGTSSDLKEALSDIDEGMQRIRRIVRELRAFAYPSNSERSAFDLKTAIEAALQMSVHELKDIGVDNQTEPGWIVLGSRNHITQVFINLFSNAARAIRTAHSDESGVISITVTKLGDRLQIAVRDNGAGIPSAAIGRIFDPFYTTADVGEGTGMGLSICQTIIHNHAGNLTVESEVGRWTQFSFDLELEAKRLAIRTASDAAEAEAP